MLRTEIFKTSLIVAGLLFLLTAAGFGKSALFIAIVPLLMHGMRYSMLDTFYCVLLSSFIIVLINPHIAAAYFFVFAVPAWLLTAQLRRQYRFTENIYVWRPAGLAIVDLALYACGVACLFVLYFELSGDGLIATWGALVKESIANAPADYAALLELYLLEMNYLFFAILAWIWILGMYAHCWVANRILVRQKKAVRSKLGIELFPMPPGTLYLLLVAALGSLIGSEVMQLLAKTCFIILLLPYVFLGMAAIHHKSREWAGREFLLFLLYLMILFQLWATLLVACAGIYIHVKQINKRLSSGSNSPK